MERVPVELEYIFKASPAILYKFLTAPSCLIRWFSDGVDIERNGVNIGGHSFPRYTFSWEGYVEEAVLLEEEEKQYLKFRWLDEENEEEFFQFDISLSEVTGETILEITDFAEAGEIDEQLDYWDKNMEKLKKACGG